MMNFLNKFKKSDSANISSDGLKRSIEIRNIIGFWILGMGNMYCYQILLSAAHDILDKDFLHPHSPEKNESYTIIENQTDIIYSSENDCNALSTGVVLLAEIIPHLIMKLILPFYHISPVCGMTIVITMMICSLLLIGFSYHVWTTFLSIVGIAIPTSLGEVVLIQYSSMFFGKKEMVAWFAGTGGGAILSSLLYAALTTAGLPTRATLLLMVTVPALMALAFWTILIRPPNIPSNSLELTNTRPRLSDASQNYRIMQSLSEIELPVKRKKNVNFISKLKQIKSLLTFALPLSLVFFSEYFINLGLYELIYFPGIWLDHSEQYRWFMTDYQMGVFVSRTLGTMLLCHKHWILPILQVINIVIFILHVIFKFIPSIWIILGLMFYEGLLGGAAFVNVFSNVMDKVSPSELEFAISVVAVGDSLGICLAGFLALPVHDFICSHLH